MFGNKWLQVLTSKIYLFICSNFFFYVVQIHENQGVSSQGGVNLIVCQCQQRNLGRRFVKIQLFHLIAKPHFYHFLCRWSKNPAKTSLQSTPPKLELHINCQIFEGKNISKCFLSTLKLQYISTLGNRSTVNLYLTREKQINADLQNYPLKTKEV